MVARQQDPKKLKLRKQIRELRRGIAPEYAVQASYRISQQVALLPGYLSSQRISAFLPFDGEISPLPLLDRAIQDGKSVFVPLMGGSSEPLRFAPWTRASEVRKNSFGIVEPVVAEEQLISACNLDLALFPLVAFDQTCNRMGVGGGYYDRSFAFVNERGSATAPILIGLAYELQRVDALRPADWDVPLDAVVTELQAYHR